MKIEKITIKNYKVFRNVEIRDLPRVCVFVGKNGVGKTTLFDIFAFLGDALKSNVSTAINKRGGFKQVISRESTDNIVFEIKFRMAKNEPLATYLLEIGEEKGEIHIEKERLQYKRGSKGRGRPYRFLDFHRGRGSAISNEEEFDKRREFEERREEQELDDKDILAIKGLGQFKRYRIVSAFRDLLERWFVANFQIEHTRNISDTGVSEHLSHTADNLSQVTKYIYEKHSTIFNDILSKMRKRIPGIKNVKAKETEDGRIVLKVEDESFKDPFISRYVSDGTLKMFAYLVLLNDPKPFPLLCIEEPENFLYPDLLTELTEEIRQYAQKGEQVFISTHSPDFLNNLNLDEVFIIRKDKGYSTIIHAKNHELLINLVDEGSQIGYLWREGFLKDLT